MSGKRTRAHPPAPDKNNGETVPRYHEPATPQPAAPVQVPAKPPRKRRPRFVL